MINQPFTIFEPYKDQLHIVMFQKDDDIHTDEDAAEKLGAQKSAGLNQVHGNKTVVITDATDRDIEADGMITTEKNLALCIRWADCQNFVIYVPEKNILGLLHAGWRGINTGAIPEFFKVLKKEFDVDGSDVLVGAGPSLCTKCAAFSDPATELPTIDPSFFQDGCVDLQGAAHQQFLTTGVLATHIERHTDCTRCMPNAYWTYRGGDRDAVTAGHTNMISCCLL